MTDAEFTMRPIGTPALSMTSLDDGITVVVDLKYGGNFLPSGSAAPSRSLLSVHGTVICGC